VRTQRGWRSRGAGEGVLISIPLDHLAELTAPDIELRTEGASVVLTVRHPGVNEAGELDDSPEVAVELRGALQGDEVLFDSANPRTRVLVSGVEVGPRQLDGYDAYVREADDILSALHDVRAR